MDIGFFLNRIVGINKHHEEIAKVTGENFNIFDILNIKLEESTHSNFIAMLLDPDGVHGRDNIFLKYFLEIIGRNTKREDISGFSIENATVQTEFSIGPIDKECEHGGRIDIAISNNKNKIFIENKIYAPDQKHQLRRYKNSCADAKIIYLTPDGRKPGNESAKDMTGDEYICISYKDDILDWLEKCKKETVDYPLLRESVQQYITLIKSLTGQARSRQMSDEILSVITKDEENLAAYLSVNAINKETVFKYVLKNKIIPELWAVAGKHGLEFEESSDADLLQENYGFKFFDADITSGNICIFFAFGEKLSDLQFGIYDDSSGGGWLPGPDLKTVGKYRNWHWNNIDVFKKLCLPNNDVIMEIDAKITELLPLFETEIKNRQKSRLL
jgi:hypothetical protein